jgi:hypothetical protein
VDLCEAKSDGHLLPTLWPARDPALPNPHDTEGREGLHALALGLKACCGRHDVDCFEVIDR